MSDDQQQQHNSGQGAIQVKGNGNLILQLDPILTKLAESQMQAAFYQATGVYCSKEARIDLESLLEKHGITVREIKRVWRAGAMTHNFKAGVFEFHNRKQDLAAGSFGASLASLVYFLFNAVFFVTQQSGPGAGVLYFAVSSLVFCMVLGLFFGIFIWPQQTAKKIRVAIQSEAPKQLG